MRAGPSSRLIAQNMEQVPNPELQNPAIRRSRPTSSARQAGYAMLGLMVVLFGLILIGVVIAPNLIPKVVEKNRRVEQKRLTQIGNSLVDSIQRRLIIPDY